MDELEADARRWAEQAQVWRDRGFVLLAAVCERQAAECRRELAHPGGDPAFEAEAERVWREAHRLGRKRLRESRDGMA
jgi:hypothetical protein